MRSPATSDTVLVGLLAGLACGCGGGNSLPAGADAASGAGAGGSMAGAGGSMAGAGGSMAGAGGSMGSPDGGESDAPGESTASARDAGSEGGVDGPIAAIAPTKGCGQDPGQELGVLVMHTIQTMGTKAAGCADSNCAPWSYPRDYFVKLPTGYDNAKAYPLLFQEPGCGGAGNYVYDFVALADTVIEVGLSPPPNAIGHATNPGQGCFDDHEGDDSVDWVFYETLYDQLAKTLCFDRNRVFSSGLNSGGSLSNELGCKYAGDATRPVRGVMPVGGDLPTDPAFAPTCTTKPMAGMWIHQVDDTEYPFADTIVAINRAMKVNGCTLGTGYADATFDNFPIGDVSDHTCLKIRGCPDLYPLVVCPLPAPARVVTDTVPDDGIPTFITLFENPPLLTQ
jgi:hypothetical protein